MPRKTKDEISKLDIDFLVKYILGWEPERHELYEKDWIRFEQYVIDGAEGPLHHPDEDEEFISTLERFKAECPCERTAVVRTKCFLSAKRRREKYERLADRRLGRRR